MVKKKHTVKNDLIINMIGRIVFLSMTYEGSVHDKKICDEEGFEYPDGATIYQDSGFQGHSPENVTVMMPVKSSKKNPLTKEQKESNRLLSRVRVKVEHAISGIKRSRIVKDTFRNWRYGLEDEVMEIACGLHNLRLAFRKIHMN